MNNAMKHFIKNMMYSLLDIVCISDNTFGKGTAFFGTGKIPSPRFCKIRSIRPMGITIMNIITFNLEVCENN
jgi:hypothetical protein